MFFDRELAREGLESAIALEETRVHLRESSEGTFERTFVFPAKVPESSAQSRFGVLEVKVAKAPEAVARRIPSTAQFSPAADS